MTKRAITFNNIEELSVHFNTIKQLVNKYFIEASSKDSSDFQEVYCNATEKVFQLLSVYKLDPEEFIISNDPTITQLDTEIPEHDDEGKIAMKIMIFIYIFVLVSDDLETKLQYEEITQFLVHVEDKILCNLFETAKKINEKSKIDKEMELDESRVENFTCEQHFILNVYVRLWNLLLRSLESISIVGYTSCPTYCSALALTKYFSEKKKKFHNENPGEYLVENKMDEDLYEELLRYWKLCVPIVFKRKSNVKHKDQFESFASIFVEHVYNLEESNSYRHRRPETLLDTITFLVYSSDIYWDSIMTIMHNDNYQVLSSIDENLIISEELDHWKRNCGKLTWVIKDKMFRIITNIVKTKWDEEGLQKKICFSASFKTLVFNTLKRTSELGSSTPLSKQSITTALVIVSLVDLAHSFDARPEDYKKLVLNILQICKKLLFSKNKDIRSLTCSSLAYFFSYTRYYSNDLLEEIIKSQELNNSNLGDYCTLLKGFSSSFLEQPVGKEYLEKFTNLIYKLFETICLDKTMEYLKEMEGSQDEKILAHNSNMVNFFRMISEVYTPIDDNQYFENILTYIMNKSREIMTNNDHMESSINLLPAFALALKEIFKSTNRNLLIDFLDKSNYYTFIVELIQIFVSERKKHSLECGPIFLLIGTLSDIEILFTHFSIKMINDENLQEGDFVHDYIIPIIMGELNDYSNTVDAVEYILNTGHSLFFNKTRDAYWAWSRIIRNDIILYGGEKSISILNNSTNKIFRSIDLSYILADQFNAIESTTDLFINAFTCLLYGPKVPSLTLELAKVVPKICGLLLKHEDMSGKILEIIEYAIDNELDELEEEIFVWIDHMRVYLLRSTHLRTIFKRILFKLSII